MSTEREDNRKREADGAGTITSDESKIDLEELRKVEREGRPVKVTGERNPRRERMKEEGDDNRKRRREEEEGDYDAETITITSGSGSDWEEFRKRDRGGGPVKVIGGRNPRREVGGSRGGVRKSTGGPAPERLGDDDKPRAIKRTGGRAPRK